MSEAKALLARSLLDRAEAAADAGEPAMARSLLQQVITEYPDTHEAAVARAALGAVSERQKADAVRVVDVDIAFSSMMWLFVKAAFAMIPAAIIIAIVWFAIVGVLGGLASGLAAG